MNSDALTAQAFPRRLNETRVTGQGEPQDAIDLASFGPAGVAVVFGATGGIGGALVEAIRTTERFTDVVAFSRATSPSITS